MAIKNNVQNDDDADIARKEPEKIEEFIKQVHGGEASNTSKQQVEKSRKPTHPDEATAHRSGSRMKTGFKAPPRSGSVAGVEHKVTVPQSWPAEQRDGSSPSEAQIADGEDKLLQIVDYSEDCVALIDGRKYAFRFGWGHNPIVDIPRPLETDEHCKEVIRPRIQELATAFNEKRKEESARYSAELREKVERILDEKEAKVQVTEGVDAILCMIDDCHKITPHYRGRAYLNGERFAFSCCKSNRGLRILRDKLPIELSDGKIADAVYPRLSKLLTKSAFRRALRIRE